MEAAGAEPPWSDAKAENEVVAGSAQSKATKEPAAEKACQSWRECFGKVVLAGGFSISSSGFDFAAGRVRHLSKGAGTTTSVWGLHALPAWLCLDAGQRGAGKAIFASQAMHAAVVLGWLSTLCFRGAHFSNFVPWSCNPFETHPAGNVPTPPLGQAFSNLAGDGEHIFAGAFFANNS